MLAYLLAAVVSTTSISSPACTALSSQIEASLKKAADIESDNVADDSAPRSTMRAAQKTAIVSSIEANIMLMQARQCKPFSRPINLQDYDGPATVCMAAISKQVSAGDYKAPAPRECDKSTWPAP